jgi:hypothetical protein
MLVLSLLSSVADAEPYVHYLVLLDPDPLVRGTEPDPSYHQAKIVRKNLVSYYFVTLFIFDK